MAQRLYPHKGRDILEHLVGCRRILGYGGSFSEGEDPEKGDRECTITVGLCVPDSY